MTILEVKSGGGGGGGGAAGVDLLRGHTGRSDQGTFAF